MQLVKNPLAHRGPYTREEAGITTRADAVRALAEIGGWDGYAVTPLRSLPTLACEMGLGAVWLKDESARLGQGSFKTLGGAYAAIERLRSFEGAGQVTLCCATDGNHGRAVAYAAQRMGCPAVVFMHENAPEPKAAAIASLGARVVRTPGTYDDSVRIAKETAIEQGWLLISDTSEPGDETVHLVMRGYGVMVLELIEQMAGSAQPTHVFLQGGVGGLAAGVAGVFTDQLGEDRPTFVVVEPRAAACLLESALQQKPSAVGGDLKTAMHMLSTGEASAAAWPVLQHRVDFFVAIDDEAAVQMAARLNSAEVEGMALDIGVSGAAGLAGLAAVMSSEATARAIGLGADSRVLVFATEAA